MDVGLVLISTIIECKLVNSGMLTFVCKQISPLRLIACLKVLLKTKRLYEYMYCYKSIRTFELWLEFKLFILLVTTRFFNENTCIRTPSLDCWPKKRTF